MTRIRLTLAVLLLALGAGLTHAAPKPYPFAIAPDGAFEKLAGLEKACGKPLALTKDEASLFEDARDGKLDQHSFADACLITSGVTDPSARKKYLAELDRIEADARKSLKDAKSASEKGERLLKFLHTGPMAKGYDLEQTDLHVLLDTGRFNCVSATVLYNVIGRRLGLDLRAVEVPEHVFSVLVDGDRRIDVQTTNARGFDPTRDRKSNEKSKKTGGAVKIPEKHAKDRREVGEAGLAALIAYNHGVALAKEKRFHDAIMANFRALALDKSNPGAASNALAGLTNWPLELAKAGKFEEGLTVLAVGLELAPKDSALRNNHKVMWGEYAESRMKAGEVNEAIAILRRAAKTGAGEDFETRQAYLFARPANDLMDAGKWDEALKVLDAGLKVVDPKAQKKLRDYRVGLFLRWAHAEEKKDRFEVALDILRRAAAEEKDPKIHHNTLAVYDAWADGYMQRGDWAAAIEVYERGLKELPGDKHLTNNLEYCRQEMKKK